MARALMRSQVMGPAVQAGNTSRSPARTGDTVTPGTASVHFLKKSAIQLSKLILVCLAITLFVTSSTASLRNIHREKFASNCSDPAALDSKCLNFLNSSHSGPGTNKCLDNGKSDAEYTYFSRSVELSRNYRDPMSD